MGELILALVSSVLDAAPALVFAAVGATVSEKSGVVNVGIEGMMRAGAFAAAAAALVMPTGAGVVVGMAAGAAVAGVHAWLSLRWNADQIISGMALNLVMLSLGTFLLEALFDSTSTSPPITPLPRVLGHTALTFAAMVAPFAVHWLIRSTPWGLRVRAAGDRPEALAVTGVSVRTIRTQAVLLSGALAGLGGAALSTAVLDRFEHHMPAGLGFMAVAAMVFGRWTPLGAAAAATFFSVGTALRIGLSSSFPEVTRAVPPGVFLALPYLLTLVVLAVQGQGNAAPAALGRPYDPERR